MKWPDAKDVSRVPYKGEIIKVKIVSVYDGDTCTAIIPFSKSFIKLSVRVEGIDTPELHVRSKKAWKDDPERCQLEEEAGRLVRDEVKPLLEGKVCKAQLLKWDKYGGRVIAHIWPDSDQSLAEYLLERGQARPYAGEKKAIWTTEELRAIVKRE